MNGTVAPFHDVSNDKIRLRLLNASNARIYNFGLVDPAGRQRGFALLSPGERAEIVVSMSPAEHLILRSKPADLRAGFWNQRFAGGDDILDILQLRAGNVLAAAPDLPDRLAPAPDLKTADASTTRRIRLGGNDINGQDMDMGRIDEVVTVGTTELWRVSNGDGSPHSFHVHDVQFVVLDAEDARPGSPSLGWKDTVYIAPDSSVRLLMRFTDYTDPDSPYMFHCHLLWHEDQGMMGQFVVVRPGQRAGQPSNHGSHD